MKYVIAKGIASTDGKGSWTDVKKDVPVELEVNYIREPEPPTMKMYGSLRAYFSESDWNTDKLGLIYTDERFVRDVRNILKRAGFKHASGISYSEQGLQGRNYVDFDIDDALSRELAKKGRGRDLPEESAPIRTVLRGINAGDTRAFRIDGVEAVVTYQGTWRYTIVVTTPTATYRDIDTKVYQATEDDFLTAAKQAIENILELERERRQL